MSTSPTRYARATDARFEDKTLRCADCGSDFVWTAGERQFYAEKGFSNEPKRCVDCRAKKRTNRQR